MKNFIFLVLLAGCADLGRVHGNVPMAQLQAVADECGTQAYNNGYADAVAWVPLAGYGLSEQKRREVFRACVEKSGFVWTQK